MHHQRFTCDGVVPNTRAFRGWKFVKDLELCLIKHGEINRYIIR